ncbi:unnamed protein product [Fusarium langsethiae]|nr:unnamed protein product [Fusarium langsethiae]
MTESSHIDEFWRSIKDRDNGNLVTATDSACFHEDEPLASIKRPKKMKKKKAKVVADSVAVEEISPSPIIEEDIPPALAGCETPMPTFAEPGAVGVEPAEEPDDGQHAQFTDDKTTINGEAEHLEPPVYLPFSAQHRLMVFLQHKLEEMCFSFSQRNLPQLLQNRAWDCPEAVELHRWVRTLSMELPYISQDWVFQHSSLFESVAKIRDCAVTRSRIDSIQIEKLMADALELATLLEEERTVKIIDRLREDTTNASKSLGAETEEIKRKFDYKLNEIEAARTKLDELENATKAALKKSLLGRQENARSKITQSIQKAEAIDQVMEPGNRSGAMSSLDLVTDLENSLMLGDEARDHAAFSRSSWFA